jgi:hypothetical protein
VTTRKARQARNRVVANRIIFALLVVVVLGAVYELVGVISPVSMNAASSAARVGRLEVSTALLGCPAPGSAGTTGGPVAIANVPLSAAGGGAALTLLNSSASAGKPVGSVPRPGQLTVENIPAAPALPKKAAGTTLMAGGQVPTSPARGGLIVSAQGANAQGLDVEQLGPGGQATARCAQAGSDFWFVGPGSAKLHFYMYLMNADNEPADVAVSVQTDSGPLLGAQDSGIVVPPHSMVVQTLDKLVHAAKAVALHVTTSTGRVVAAVRESTSASDEGTWLPVAEEPATRQYLAGLPGTSGARQLYVTVPGNASAEVKVTVITARGSYQPTGGTGISLLPHQSTGISIPSLSGLTGTIEISANVPITGTLVTPGGPKGAPGAFIVGSGAIIGPGVVAASTAGRLGTTEVELSAPLAAASVRIVQATPGSPLTGSQGQVVHIPARSSVEVPLSLPKRLDKTPLIALVVTPLPGSGPVYAGRVSIIRNSVQTVIPVVSSPDSIQFAGVRESLLAILGS